MTVIPRYVPPASNCTIASPRSPTRLRGSRKKGGSSSSPERAASLTHACPEEDRGGLARTRTGICPDPSSSTRAGQSRKRKRSGGAGTLQKGIGHDARAASVSGYARRGHRHVLEGNGELLARLIPWL